MQSQSEWENTLREICRRNYPDFIGEVEFFPLSELRHGDIGTDVCEKIAAVYKTAPFKICKQILSEISGSPGEINFAEGVLAVRVSKLQSSNTSAKQSESKNYPYLIVAPAPDKEINGPSYLRMTSGALFQFALLKSKGYETRLIVPGIIDTREGNLSVLECFTRIVDLAAQSKSYQDKDFKIESYIDLIIEAPQVALWIGVSSLAENSFARITSSQKGILNLKSLSLDYLRFEETAVQLQSYTSAVKSSDLSNSVSNLFWYLLTPEFGIKLDLEIPRHNEKSNHLWFMAALLERIKRMQINQSSELSECLPSNKSGDDVIRVLKLRLYYFNDFIIRAALKGEVLDFGAAFCNFLDRANFFINSPNLRKRSDSGALTTEEKEIIAGVSRVISSMIDFHKRFVVEGRG